MERRNKDIKDEIFVGHLPVSHQLAIMKNRWLILYGSCDIHFISAWCKSDWSFRNFFRMWPDSWDTNDVWILQSESRILLYLLYGWSECIQGRDHAMFWLAEHVITLRTIPRNCPKIRAVQDIKGSRVIHKNFGKFGEKVRYGISYTV